eukprot:TRINITY_DN16966_c2_g1_i1.p3 TRINITY_DN16966_c2_g1~~TRINITY_DN16966_c2_g1_i1.p3  ORF type:complete len:109 (-),score=7.41 TRINITY_DN16966_c2_g1_i1:43-369(-)
MQQVQSEIQKLVRKGQKRKIKRNLPVTLDENTPRNQSDVMGSLKDEDQHLKKSKKQRILFGQLKNCSEYSEKTDVHNLEQYQIILKNISQKHVWFEFDNNNNNFNCIV